MSCSSRSRPPWLSAVLEAPIHPSGLPAFSVLSTLAGCLDGLPAEFGYLGSSRGSPSWIGSEAGHLFSQLSPCRDPSSPLRLHGWAQFVRRPSQTPICPQFWKASLSLQDWSSEGQDAAASLTDQNSKCNFQSSWFIKLCQIIPVLMYYLLGPCLFYLYIYFKYSHQRSQSCWVSHLPVGELPPKGGWLSDGCWQSQWPHVRLNSTVTAGVLLGLELLQKWSYTTLVQPFWQKACW